MVWSSPAGAGALDGVTYVSGSWLMSAGISATHVSVLVWQDNMVHSLVATWSQQRQPKPPCSIIMQFSARSTFVVTEHIARSSPDLRGGKVASMIEGVTKRLWPFFAIHQSEEARGLKHSCRHSSGSFGACFEAFPHPTKAPPPWLLRVT